MNYYYEISNAVLTGLHYSNKYVTSGENYRFGHAMVSARIWVEDEDGIRYTKNMLNPDAAVDIKEFMWIKLKCHQI